MLSLTLTAANLLELANESFGIKKRSAATIDRSSAFLGLVIDRSSSLVQSTIFGVDEAPILPLVVLFKP